MATLFSFIARNPSTMLIAGGILFILMSSGIRAVQASASDSLSSAGWVLIGVGVLLHVVWLRGRRH